MAFLNKERRISMKKLGFLLAVLLLSGCQNTDGQSSGKVNNANYSPSSEDVVDRNGEIENFERFEKFKSNTEKGIQDKLTIVQYTTEGEPIFHQLDYDGIVIKSTIDTSRDHYGAGEIYHNTCTSIEMIERTDATEYNLQGCEEGLDNTVLVIWKY